MQSLVDWLESRILIRRADVIYAMGQFQEDSSVEQEMVILLKVMNVGTQKQTSILPILIVGMSSIRHFS